MTSTTPPDTDEPSTVAPVAKGTARSDVARRDTIIAWTLLVLLAVGFLVAAWPRLTGPLGDSDDGINASVVGYNSRSMRELGIVDSRFGGLRLDGTKYAPHPPLIIGEAALVEAVLGEHPWTTRGASFLNSMVSIFLLYLLLRTVKLRPPVAAAATVCAMASHMIFVYGVMADTMMTSLPWALAVTIVWYRQWTGRTAPPWWAILLLSAATCFGGWQATFLVGLCGVSTAARFRSDRRALLRALPYLVGVVIGVGATLSSVHWVYGSFSVLGEKLSQRTGAQTGVTAWSMITFQVPWLAQLLGIGFLAWVACAISLRERRFRPLAALWLTSVIVYALILKDGAGGHQYWNFWGVVPAAIGFAYGFDALMKALARRGRRQPLLPVGVLLGLTALIVAVNITRPNQAGALIDQGYATYDYVVGTPLPPGQTELPYVAQPYRIDDWVRYRGGPPTRPLMSADELRTLAREHPDDLVLLLGTCAEPDPTGICDTLTFGPGAPAGAASPTFVRAADLARRLPS